MQTLLVDGLLVGLCAILKIFGVYYTVCLLIFSSGILRLISQISETFKPAYEQALTQTKNKFDF